jgi:hypothetical protein
MLRLLDYIQRSPVRLICPKNPQRLTRCSSEPLPASQPVLRPPSRPTTDHLTVPAARPPAPKPPSPAQAAPPSVVAEREVVRRRKLNMPARQQIFTGATTLITGVFLQIFLGFRASSISGPVVEGVIESGHSAEGMDYLLEQSHLQMLWMFVAWILSWLLIAAGAILVIWGVHRHFSRKKPTGGIKSPSRTP